MKGLFSKSFLILFIFFLSACGGGGSDSGGGNTAPPANIAPTADAGADLSVNEQDTITFSGSGTDTDGIISSYSWTQISGEPFALSEADSASATFNSPATAVELSATFQLTVTDNDGATGTDSITITINPIDIQLSDIPTIEQRVIVTPIDGVNSTSPLSMLSSYRGTTVLNTDSSTALSRYDENEIVFVTDDTGQIVMLSQFLEGMSDLEVNSKTTALTLLSTFPSLAESYSVNPISFVNSISEFIEVKALSDAIQATNNWIDGNNDIVVNAYADAVIRVYNEIENGLLSTQKLGSVNNKRVRVLNDIDPKSGITLIVTGEQDVTENPEFLLRVDNSLDRYLTVVLGTTGANDFDSNNGTRTFMVGPNVDTDDFFSVYDLESVTELYKSSLLIENNGDFFVQVYGPGEMGKLLNYVPDEYEQYAKASIASIIHYQAIPTHMAWWGIKKRCLRSKWIPTINENGELVSEDDVVNNWRPSLFQSNATSTEIYRDALTNGRFVEAGVVAFFQLLTFNQDDISDCMVDNQLDILTKNVTGSVKNGIKDSLSAYANAATEAGKRFNPLLRAVNDIISLRDDSEKIYSLNPAFESTFKTTKKSEFWTIENNHVKDNEKFTISDSNDGAITSAALTLSNANSDTNYIYDFTEDCPEGHICKQYVFPRTRPERKPFSIDFSGICDNEGGSNDCRHMLIYFGDGTFTGEVVNQESLNLGKATHVYESTEATQKKTYSGVADVSDLDGAITTYGFTLQLEEAVPNIEFLVDGQKYIDGINNTFQCENGQTVSSKVITISNNGLGSFYINTLLREIVGLNSETWQLSDDFTSGELASGESQERTLSYNCDDFDATDYWSTTFEEADTNIHNKELRFIPDVKTCRTYSLSASAWEVRCSVPGSVDVDYEYLGMISGEITTAFLVLSNVNSTKKYTDWRMLTNGLLDTSGFYITADYLANKTMYESVPVSGSNTFINRVAKQVSANYYYPAYALRSISITANNWSDTSNYTSNVQACTLNEDGSLYYAGGNVITFINGSGTSTQIQNVNCGTPGDLSSVHNESLANSLIYQCIQLGKVGRECPLTP